MNSVLLALLLLVQGIAGQTGTVEGRVLNQDGTPVAARSALTGIDFNLARPSALKVSGRVIREGNVPIVVTERVLMSGPGGSRNVIIPPDGAFEFVGVSPGRYTIGVSTNGSQPQQIVVNDKDVQVELLIPITVTVTGALNVVDNAPRPRLGLLFVDGAVRASALVASNGTYTVQLRPGNYSVGFNGLPAGYVVKSITSGTKDLLNEQFDVAVGNTSQFAVTLDVSSPPPWRRVSGRIQGMPQGPQGFMPPGANVVSMTGTNAGEILEAPLKADGTFEFPRIIPGQYSVRTTVSRLLAPLTITVGNTDVDNVEFVVPRQVDVRGRVVIEGGGAIPRLSTLPFNTSVGGVTFSTLTTPVRGDEFTLSLPEGEQRVALNPALTTSRGFTVKAMTYGSTNLLTDTVKIDSSNTATEILVTLAPTVIANPVKITGRVTNIPPSLGPILINVVGGVRTSLPTINDSGEFEISNLAPGSYTVHVNASALRHEIAVPVSVGAQGVTGLEIPFPPRKEVAGRIALDPGDLTVVYPRFWLTLQGANTITIYTTPSPDGSFVAQLPVGEWRFQIGGLPAGFALKSLMYGTTNLLTAPLRVAADDTQELRLVVGFTNALVKVSGRVIEPTREQQTRVQYTPPMPTVQLSGSMQVETPLKMPEGTFEFSRMLPGLYGWIHSAGSTPITIPNRDVTDLTIRSLVGRVILEGVTLTPNMSGSLAAYNGRLNALARIQADGSFIFRLPPGTYQIIWTSALPGAPYVKSVRSGAAELPNQTLTVSPDKEAPDLIVTIAKQP